MRHGSAFHDFFFVRKQKQTSDRGRDRVFAFLVISFARSGALSDLPKLVLRMGTTQRGALVISSVGTVCIL